MHPYELGINAKTSITLHKTYAIDDVKKPTVKKFNQYMKLVNDYKNNILSKSVNYELNRDGIYYSLFIRHKEDVDGIYFTVRKKP